jgi:colanic acid/amylovoran biosynthesis glycosyltransferase
VKRVTIWRNIVLPNSETFIANQIKAMRRWRPVLVGRIAVENSLGVVPAFTTHGYGHPLLLRSAAGVYRRTGTTPRLHRQFRRSELIHAHFGPDALGIAAAARRARRPLVATFHGYDITTLKQGVDIDYRPLFDQASRLVAQSNFIRAELLGAGAPDEKVHILPIGIPLVPEAPTTVTDRAVLFVGRLVEVKGCGDLIRAVSGLPETPAVTVIGDGPLRGELEALATELRVPVRFLGTQPPDFVAKAMSEHRALCVPSKRAPNGAREGFGMVFLEAAAHRLPVISYASGGVPEAVLDGLTGLLAPEGDVPALARNIQCLLDDHALAVRMGAAGRVRVEREFEIAKCTSALEELYDDVVSRQRGW